MFASAFFGDWSFSHCLPLWVSPRPQGQFACLPRWSSPVLLQPLGALPAWCLGPGFLVLHPTQRVASQIT